MFPLLPFTMNYAIVYLHGVYTVVNRHLHDIFRFAAKGHETRVDIPPASRENRESKEGRRR